MISKERFFPQFRGASSPAQAPLLNRPLGCRSPSLTEEQLGLRWASEGNPLAAGKEILFGGLLLIDFFSAAIHYLLPPPLTPLVIRESGKHPAGTSLRVSPYNSFSDLCPPSSAAAEIKLAVTP